MTASLRFSNLIENIPGMVFRAKHDKPRTLEFLSNASISLIGRKSKELLHENFALQDLIHEEDIIDVSNRIDHGLESSQTYSVTYKLNEDLAVNKWVIESGNLVKDLTGDWYIEGSIFDITDRVGLEEHIAATTMETEDRERTRISKEIHDGLQQTLGLSAMMFDNMKHSEGIKTPDLKLLDDGIKFLNRAIEECRDIAHRLMPASITDFGLRSSIETLVQDMNSSGSIEISFISNLTDDARLKKPSETSLFRIVQEAFNNINKHSSAKTCSIQLLKIGGIIQLSIEDDGIGFEPGVQQNDGSKLGLRNMENRATSMSGQLLVESKAKGGTLIICRIPFNHNKFS
jgi:signal transduction histidine kinase